MGIASPLVKLDSGHLMPLVGFGCWKVDNATCADTSNNAIKAGYRLFDGACGEDSHSLSEPAFRNRLLLTDGPRLRK